MQLRGGKPVLQSTISNPSWQPWSTIRCWENWTWYCSCWCSDGWWGERGLGVEQGFVLLPHVQPKISHFGDFLHFYNLTKIIYVNNIFIYTWGTFVCNPPLITSTLSPPTHIHNHHDHHNTRATTCGYKQTTSGATWAQMMHIPYKFFSTFLILTNCFPLSF